MTTKVKEFEFLEMTRDKKAYDYLDLPNQIFVETDDIDSLYWYFYHVKTFKSWFCLPGMFFFSKNKYFNKDSILRCFFPFFPFYWMKCKIIKSEINKFYTYEFTGCMQGVCSFVFEKKDKGYLVNYELNVRGANILLHLFYQVTLKLCHDLQTPYCLKKLKQKFESRNYKTKKQIENES